MGVKIIAVRYCLQPISAIRRGKKESLSKESPFYLFNIQIKNRLLPTAGQVVNSLQCAFTVLNFNTKGATMEQIERCLEEIESALYKMSPVEREHLMEVLHIAFPEYFKKDFMS